MDIVEFLTARLDEEQRVAEHAATANPPPWRTAGEGGHVRGGVVPRRNDYIDGGLWDNESAKTLEMAPSTAEHVARHDPARVLADVAAKRAILEEHWPQNSDLFPEDGPQWCQTCADRKGWPCLTVRALAQPYADHPDFDSAWRSAVATP